MRHNIFNWEVVAAYVPIVGWKTRSQWVCLKMGHPKWHWFIGIMFPLEIAVFFPAGWISRETHMLIKTMMMIIIISWRGPPFSDKSLCILHWLNHCVGMFNHHVGWLNQKKYIYMAIETGGFLPLSCWSYSSCIPWYPHYYMQILLVPGWYPTIYPWYPTCAG